MTAYLLRREINQLVAGIVVLHLLRVMNLGIGIIAQFGVHEAVFILLRVADEECEFLA